MNFFLHSDFESVECYSKSVHLKLVRHQLQAVLTMALSLMSLSSKIQKGEKDDMPRGLKIRCMI